MDLDRESQVARSGLVVGLEAMLDGHYIKTEDIPVIKEIMEKYKSQITIPDILKSMEDSKRVKPSLTEVAEQ